MLTHIISKTRQHDCYPRCDRSERVHRAVYAKGHALNGTNLSTETFGYVPMLAILQKKKTPPRPDGAAAVPPAAERVPQRE